MQTSPRLQLAFVLAAIGLGVLLYGGYQWQHLPHYSDNDIAASIELNLSLDVARRGSDHAPTDEQLEALRKGIRAEIDAEIAKGHETVQSWLAAGTMLMVVAFVQVMLQRYLPGGSGRRP